MPFERIWLFLNAQDAIWIIGSFLLTDDEGTWRKWVAMREARAQIDALEVAPDLDQVTGYRQRHSWSGELLPIDELTFWMEREHAKALQGSIDALEDPLSPAHRLTPIVVEVRRPRAGKQEELITCRAQFAPESDLYALNSLAFALTEKFGWTHASAAGWVLTGSLPVVPEIDVQLLPRSLEGRERWKAIQITVPVEMPPSVLAHRYAKERKAALEGLPPLPENPIGDKALLACVFALQRNDGRTWESVSEDWSRQWAGTSNAKPFAFQSARNFAYTVRQTYQRLTGRKLDWKRSRGQRGA